MKKVIVILGPTASGKTALSIAIAKKYGGEIINGDSMQVYKGMNIGTAKIKENEKQNIPHHLFDFLEVGQNNSIGDYQLKIRTTIDHVIEQNKIPIIVGGTGLYLKSALYDYIFADNSKRKSEIENKYAGLSNQELHNLLINIDSVSAQKIHMNNRRRILRALEIYESSGTTKTQMEAMQEHKCLYDVLFIGLNLNRAELRQRIDLRVDQMFAQGLLQEVELLFKNPQFLASSAGQAIGYKEFIPYLNKQATLEEVKERIKINTHQYAKRQSTWFNNQLPVKWIDVNLSDFDKTIELSYHLVDMFYEK